MLKRQRDTEEGHWICSKKKNLSLGLNHKFLRKLYVLLILVFLLVQLGFCLNSHCFFPLLLKYSSSYLE